ncbi:MAG TPA: phosphoribosylformylglycinamidine synthase subunit PurQ [Candidatus Paceibacterota bacterium]
MTKPRAVIFSGYGLNTEDETKSVFESVGADADIVHINDVVSRPAILARAQIAVFPGGFSYGDHTGSGKAYGTMLRRKLGRELERFLARNTLAIGICNGFQILTSAGLLPGALVGNDGGRYLCRWVDLKVVGKSPWLEGIETLSVPIAHGEGKYVAPKSELDEIEKKGNVALTYVEGEISRHFALPHNPNGASRDIAGVTSHGGRVLGLMPHPERAVRFTQLPHWTYLRERYIRDGADMPAAGPGLTMFRNAVRYFA